MFRPVDPERGHCSKNAAIGLTARTQRLSLEDKAARLPYCSVKASSVCCSSTSDHVIPHHAPPWLKQRGKCTTHDVANDFGDAGARLLPLDSVSGLVESETHQRHRLGDAL